MHEKDEEMQVVNAAWEQVFGTSFPTLFQGRNGLNGPISCESCWQWFRDEETVKELERDEEK